MALRGLRCGCRDLRGDGSGVLSEAPVSFCTNHSDDRKSRRDSGEEQQRGEGYEVFDGNAAHWLEVLLFSFGKALVVHFHASRSNWKVSFERSEFGSHFS